MDANLGSTPELEATLARADADARQVNDAVLGLALDLTAINAELGRRSGTGRPVDDLLEKAIRIKEQAGKLRQLGPLVLAATLQADILLAMDGAAEAIDVLSDALAATDRGFSAHAGAAGSAPQREQRVIVLARMAQAYMTLKDWPSLSRVCGEAIAEIECDRYKVNTPYLRATFLRNRGNVYLGGVVAAMKLDDRKTMLERMELSKARGAVSASSTASASGADPDLQERFRAISEGVKKNPTNEQLARRRRIWDLMAIERNRARSNADLPVFSLNAFQGVLGADEAALYYYWLSRQFLLVVAVDGTRTTVELVSLADDERAKLDSLMLEIGQLTTAPTETSQQQEAFRRLIADVDAGIEAFSQTLLPGKARDLIASKRRLLVSPHLMLHRFPFHALRWQDGRLVERLTVGYIPNLSTQLTAYRSSAPPKALIVGISQFSDPNVPTLPGVPEEIKGIEKAYREAGVEVVVLRDQQATRAELLRRGSAGDLLQFRWIHLATHGTSVLSDVPLESSIMLFDGPLDGLEIAELPLAADVVVLSACNSAERATSARGMKELPGDELLGLQAAFNIAGARSVLGCLWPAEDDVAASVMIDVHGGLAAGDEPESALQSALVKCLAVDELTESYYWAPYTLSNMGRGS